MEVQSLLRLIASLALASLGAVCPLPVRGQDYLAVSAESPLYEDLDHFRALGLWQGSLAARPMTRAEISQAVREIQERSRRMSLGPGDDVRLRAMAEWASGGADSSRSDRSGGGSSRSEEASTCPTVRGEAAAELRFVGSATGLDSLVDLDRSSRRDWALRLSLDAGIGPHLVIQERLFEDYSRLSPDPGEGSWVDNMPLDSRGIFTDPSARNDRAVLGWGWSWGDLRYGREDRQWGWGRRGALLLSENAFPMDGLCLRFRTRFVSGSSLFAQTGRTSQADTVRAAGGGDSWFAAHRIEVHPPWPVRLGLYEAVAYGGRGIDLAYANPVGVLVAETQDIGDRFGADDKKIVGADLQVDLSPVVLHGEFLLNRLVTLDSAPQGAASEISGFAEQAGLRWANPCGLSGADLDVEYAHLDPEVYFHHDRDPGRALLTGGELIGHWLGPNADGLWIAISAPPSRRLGVLRLSLEQARWGLLEGRRGLQAGFIGLRKKDKRWITGPKQVERVLSLEWTRSGWKTELPGTFDTALTLAGVERVGPRALLEAAWSGRGWQAELRLTWRFRRSWTDAKSS